MALFFDAEWFDAKLASRSLSRGDASRALGIDDEAITLIWKDQRELSAHDVAALAALIGAAPEEVANRAGISTPVPRAIDNNPAAVAAQLGDITERLARLERGLADVKALLLDLRGRS
jgi:hypothetical protein